MIFIHSDWKSGLLTKSPQTNVNHTGNHNYILAIPSMPRFLCDQFLGIME